MGRQSTRQPNALLPADADQDFIARLHQLAGIAGSASALAKKAHISPSGLSRYFGGGEPSRKVLLALAQATGTSVRWLASGTGSMLAEEPDNTWGTLRRLPLLSMDAPSEAMPAGDDTDFTAQAFCFRWLGKNGFDIENLVAMEVRGDSMAPTLKAGSVVLVDLTRKQIEDDGIYLIRDTGVTLLRRLQLEVSGQVRALADNPRHREFTIPLENIELLGKVVWGSAFL
ncbi:MAG: helix-turn-helix transcriptional regulator [Xenophilus sp.]